jgi:hypothetical protein
LSKSPVPKVRLHSDRKISNPRRDWWNVEESEAWSHASAVLEGIKDREKHRIEHDSIHAQLYSLEEFRAHNLALYGFAEPVARPVGRITMNVIKPVVDTAAAKIAKNKPRPLFLTEKAPYTKQQSAKKLSQFIEGFFEENEVYEKGQQVFQYGGVYGTGFLKPYRVHDQIMVDPIIASEVWTDEIDSLYGYPQVMFQVRYLHRDTIADSYADGDEELKNRIKGAQPAKDLPTGNPYASETLQLVEAWKLPTNKDKSDGKRILFVDGVTIAFEPWEKTYFPFAKFTWSPRLLGYFGSGIPEELIGIQIEINRILKDISEAHTLFAVPRVLAHDNARMSVITNKIGSILKWHGKERPEFFTPQAFPSEVYQHLERLYNRAFEITGVSQLSATGKKPSGLDAAVALREYQDIETDRFMLAGQRYEKLYLQLATMIVDIADEIYEANPKLSAKVKGRKFIQSISWKDINLDKDAYIMDVFPASALPRSPAGRIQTAQEWYKEGIIDKEEFLKICDIPDLEDLTSLKLASIDDAKAMIEQMLDHGKSQVPNTLGNLQLQLQISQSAALRAKQDGYPEERLELVYSFIKQCLAELKKLEPPPALPAPAPALPAPPQEQLAPLPAM